MTRLYHQLIVSRISSTLRMLHDEYYMNPRDSIHIRSHYVSDEASVGSLDEITVDYTLLLHLMTDDGSSEVFIGMNKTNELRLVGYSASRRKRTETLKSRSQLDTSNIDRVVVEVLKFIDEITKITLKIEGGSVVNDKGVD